LGGALNVGVTPVEVKEIVYQAVPYVGMAKVYDGSSGLSGIVRHKSARIVASFLGYEARRWHTMIN
jgi:alkylhydroperoxidase/carboxymuconolactone decarboxylase family protein YurZ